MRAKRQADQALMPSGTMSKREMDASCLKSSSPNPQKLQTPIQVNLPSVLPNLFKGFSDHAVTAERAEPQGGTRSKSLYTLSKPKNTVELGDPMTGPEDVTVSDSSSSSSDSQVSKSLHHDLDKEYDNPWKTLRPKWHTNGDGDDDDLSSDKESGYWSNSNETTTSARSRTSPLQTPRVTQVSLPRDRFRLERNYCRPMPKSNELCRNWLRGQCDRGYSCRHIHEESEYDGDSVSFLTLLCSLCSTVL